MPSWARTAPSMYSIVTGFFPETSPKGTWETNPRPLLVCGRANNPETGEIFCRVAYGTTKQIEKAHENDLVIGNISLLNQLKLKHTTRFVIHSGRHLAIMPWTDEFFRPWSDVKTPVRSVLPEVMQRFVGTVLAELPDLPAY